MINFCDEIIVKIKPLTTRYDVTKLLSTFLYLFEHFGLHHLYCRWLECISICTENPSYGSL